ncbi:hypothetical protein PFISCL1PPCAC_8947, partial [Pristionchus fissidentatus]
QSRIVCERLRAMNRAGEFSQIGAESYPDYFVPNSVNARLPTSVFRGCGGYGAVIFQDSQDPSDPGIAVKKFISPFEYVKKAQRCFRELQLLRELSHDNIAKLKFTNSPDNSAAQLESVYLATEFAGYDLRVFLDAESAKNKQFFTLIHFKRMLSELLRALQYLNSAKVIHRDLKPDNLAIDSRYNYKLTLLDFGIARVDDKMTNGPGNCYYRAIETTAFGEASASDHLAYNEKADIWSIGAILYEMLTGEILFKGDYPLHKSIEICGQIPECVLSQITHKKSREHLRLKSENVKRIDFIKRLTEERQGRSWLQQEIEKNSKELEDFFSRTLAYDCTKRMTVDEALAHDFLAEVRDVDKEILASHSVVDVGDATLDEWKELIWRAIHANPVTFDHVLIR